MKSNYYQIHMGEVDVEKMTMGTRYGSYEFLIMLFRLCNAPFNFTTLLNSIFHEKLDEFIIIYIYDILVYSKFVEVHVIHLEFVLQKFKENKLYSNKAKSEFTSLKMDFLGHLLSQEGMKPNPKKIELIKECQSPISTKGVKSFLGLANFYNMFIKDFSALAKPFA